MRRSIDAIKLTIGQQYKSVLYRTEKKVFVLMDQVLSKNM